MSGRLSDDQVARILDAVETIEASLGRLVDVRANTDRDAYRDDPDVRDVVERRFVKLTEAALDVGTVLVVHERGAPPSSNPETMRQLGELGIVSHDLAADLEDAARFRNVLAHTYGNAIDHDVVYDSLHDLERYREFVVAVRDHLDSTGTLE